jgi:hypothetical protein
MPEQREVDVIKRRLGMIATAGTLLIGPFEMQPALAQKSGGVLKISFFDIRRACRCTRKRPARRFGR